MSDIINRLAHLKNAYEMAQKEIIKLAKVAEKRIKYMNRDFLLGRFDELLQLVLICTASALGEYRETDHRIIEGLAKKGDLVKGYNKRSKDIGENIELSWASLYNVLSNLDVVHRTELQAMLSSAVYDRAIVLVKTIAPVACEKSRHSLFRIVRRIRIVVTAFINTTTPDGALEDKLAKAKMSQAVLEKMLIAPWLMECEGFSSYCEGKYERGVKNAKADARKITRLNDLEDEEDKI